MSEPGLDLHDWESEWASLEEGLRDSPAESLPDLHHLIGRILRERRILDEGLVATDGADSELLRAWQAGADLVRQVDEGQRLDPGDVASAIENYRAVYETLVNERAAP